MATLTNKSKYLAIALAFTGFLVFSAGIRFGYQCVSALLMPTMVNAGILTALKLVSQT